jgi:guanylate kinase
VSKTLLLVGPSCVGKSVVMELLIKHYKEFVIVDSYTTRVQREGDTNYHFVTKEEFDELDNKGQFLETSEYVGAYYGTPLLDYFEWMEKGFIPVKAVDLKGAMTFKDLLGEDALVIFLSPPSRKEIIRRMVKRNGLLDQSRLDNLPLELSAANLFDYNLINADLEETVHTILNILEKEENIQWKVQV